MPLGSIIVADVTSMIILRLLYPADWSLDLDQSSGKLDLKSGAVPQNGVSLRMVITRSQVTGL